MVFYHFRVYLGIPWLEFAFIAVDLFFILSGIVLGMKYTAATESGMPFSGLHRYGCSASIPDGIHHRHIRCRAKFMGVPSGVYVAARNVDVWTLFFICLLSFSDASTSAFPADGPARSLWTELAINALWIDIIRLGRR